MPRCGCHGNPARYSSGRSFRKSSNSSNGSNSVGSPKPNARRRWTPAPSRVGRDWATRLTGRMDTEHLVDSEYINAQLSALSYQLSAQFSLELPASASSFRLRASDAETRSLKLGTGSFDS